VVAERISHSDEVVAFGVVEQKRECAPKIPKRGLAAAQVSVTNHIGIARSSTRSAREAERLLKPAGKDDAAPISVGDRRRASSLRDQVELP
jgi:hypothetical protein